MKGDRLGEFEEFTLLAIRALDGDAYCVPVQEYLEHTTGRAVSMGAVYAALDRLERKGFLRSNFGDPTPERGGKRKRIFTVTTSGVRALRELRGVRDHMWRAIDGRSRS